MAPTFTLEEEQDCNISQAMDMVKDDEISTTDAKLNIFEIIDFNRCYIFIFTLN